ncbi:alpha-tectorin-like [Salvelinus sp. IW2-2015]|uniref:alpha-tectorin-like n=1 Tax=Salvelinus sp. IW2-2015 TaxID=2691554 RepID=UPI000CDFEC56|nr:IgGFc-binding protein-like [Salvelinus alpinus]
MCTYTLAKGSGLERIHLVGFSVQVENEKWNKQLSVTMQVALDVYNYTLVLNKNVIGVLVNRMFNHQPLSLSGGAGLPGGLPLYHHNGLHVTYDLVYHVTVTVPGNYRGKTSSQCGNFNGNPGDDLLLPNGKLLKDVTTFGKLVIPGKLCDACTQNTCPKRDPAQRAVFEKPHYCGVITAPLPPAIASWTPSPTSTTSSLTCVPWRVMERSCVTAYAFNCHMAGVDVKNWRTASFCPNSHCEVYVDACSDLAEIDQCSNSCSEGCECDAGFFFNRQTFIEQHQCGCYEDGRSYKPGEVSFEGDCGRKCSCDPVKGLVCVDHSCPKDTKCLVRKDVKACYDTGKAQTHL